MGVPSVRTRTLVVVTAAALGVVLGALALVPPPVTRNPAEEDFSLSRARETIEAIATEPRPLGSPANARGRATIIGSLEELGLAVEQQSFLVPDYYGDAGTVEGVNLLARIPGESATGAIVVMAHHDTVPGTPGAADDTSGVAILLEVGRALRLGPPLANDVVLLFTDGEEPAPRYGSTRFVEEHPWSDDVGFVINLEAIGSGGPSLLIESAGSDEVVRSFARAAPAPAVYSFVTALTRAIGGSNTDFAPFRDAGIPGAEFAFAHGSSVYHTARDSPDRMSSRSLDQQGRNTLALVRRVGDLDLSTMRGEDTSTYLTIGRGAVMQYPAVLDAAVAVLALAAAIVLVRVRRSWSVLPHDLLRLTAMIAGIAATAAVVWWLVGSWRSEMGLIEAETWLFLLSLAAVAACMWRPPPAPESVLVAWVGLALVTSFALPGAGAAFTWTALVAVVVVSLRAPWIRLAGAGLATLTTLVLMVPLVDVLFVFAQPRPGNPDSELLWFAGLPLALVALSALVVRSLFPLSGSTADAAPSEPGVRAEPSDDEDPVDLGRAPTAESSRLAGSADDAHMP